MRLTGAAALLPVALVALLARSQSSPKIPITLRFEVATIKPTETLGDAGGIRPAPGGERYVASNVPLKLCLQVAYRLTADQIAGGPAWINTASI